MKPEVKQACTQAMRWLAKREYCCADMRLRLQGKGFDADVVEAAMQWLLAQNVLSEQRYADAFMRQQLRRGYTPEMIRRRLQQSGVDAPTTEDAAFDAVQACRRLLQRRDPQGRRFGDRKVRLRLIRYLQGRGYPLSLILDMIDCSEEGNEDDGDMIQEET